MPQGRVTRVGRVAAENGDVAPPLQPGWMPERAVSMDGDRLGANIARTTSRGRNGLMADPEPKSRRDAELDAADEARRAAEADVAAGRVVPHERVRQWLAKLARGEREPPPDA